MIRPIEYCLTLAHIEDSLSAIDQRMLELLTLRDTYCEKAKTLQKEKENLAHTTFYEKLVAYTKINATTLENEQQ